MYQIKGTTALLDPHPGQEAALDSPKRYVLALAGTQGGKTITGPWWLIEEMQRCGSGDYLYVGPTLTLLKKKAIPELVGIFERRLRLGTFNRSAIEFHFSPHGHKKLFGETRPDPPTRIMFGYATKPETLESATVKAAVLDEAGQSDFKLASWEAILRRLSIAQGRVFIGTTPYNLGWLKQKIFDPWREAPELDPYIGTFKDSSGKWRSFRFERHAHPEIDVVNFESLMNPTFPVEEFESMQGKLPAWKFDMFYRGRFTRPAGLIYESFREAHKIAPFQIPPHWPRYIGMDFGGTNFAALFYAENPATGTLYLYREYKTGKKTVAEHARDLLRGEPLTSIRKVHGGQRGEGNWRREFAAAGLAVHGPSVKSVEVGIDRVFAVHADTGEAGPDPDVRRHTGGLYVFETLEGYLEEKMTYSRDLDEFDEPTEKIADKESFHRMDAERYIIQEIRKAGGAPAYQAIRG